jgi:hypothetical protein
MSSRRGSFAGIILGLLLLAIVEFRPAWSSDPNGPAHWMVLGPCDIRLDDFNGRMDAASTITDGAADVRPDWSPHVNKQHV